MKLKLSEPGYVVSGGVHLLVLLLLIVSFAGKPEVFDPAQETVPIETVSDSEFNKVMQGDKSAKEVVKDATTKVDKVDPNPDPTPKPVTAQADKTVPTPPPPPTPPQPPTPAKPAPPPVAAAAPPPPPPPPVPTPPSRPAPPPPTNVPTPPERADADAEPIAPKPVPTPPQPPQRVAEAKPTPPPKPRPVPKPPRVMPKPDQLAKLLDQTDDTPTPTPAEKPAPKATKAARQPAPPAPPAPPPAAEQTDEQSHTFDLTDITKLLSHDAPAQKAATGRAPSRVASLGSPTAHDDKMAPSLWGQLDGLMEEQYRQCWSYLGLNAGQKYVPQIRVTYDESGGLASEPVLVNPPTDPALRNLAESAMRAVRRCNPLRIPAQYAPYYDEWRGRVLRFDPQEMAG